jgi:hypothetical protein
MRNHKSRLRCSLIDKYSGPSYKRKQPIHTDIEITIKKITQQVRFCHQYLRYWPTMPWTRGSTLRRISSVSSCRCHLLDNTTRLQKKSTYPNAFLHVLSVLRENVVARLGNPAVRGVRPTKAVPHEGVVAPSQCSPDVRLRALRGLPGETLLEQPH